MNTEVRRWVEEQARLCQPDAVHWCDGSEAEYRGLCALLVRQGTFTELNASLRPGSFLARSDARDVARVEDRTFICSLREDDAGPTNNWREPGEMKRELLAHFSGSMRGRTMYIIPYLMGPPGSALTRAGVQVTDSAYVACSMRIMTRMGEAATQYLDGDWVRCLHSVGCPLGESQPDVPWPCNEQKYIAHFPESREIWSYGSGYGGNALLGKKCFALRIGSCMARDEGWLAEHMLILGITSPAGRKRYFAAAFPSQCGKTSLSMLDSPLPGWKIECVGDDIAWMRFGENGQLYAINPEAGFFAVAPGTSVKSNPNAMATVTRDTLFTNVARTPEGDVWWEGVTEQPPPEVIDWRGNPWQPGSPAPAAHPNSRYTASVARCPVADLHWDDPDGVPISAILFGGRRPSTIPLVYEALNWRHGVFIGSTVASQTTAAADGATGRVRRDPFAMLPFCGYNIGDYFAHWLNLGQRLPPIYGVNWFRQDAAGRYLWPGYGDNIRVLKWIFERLEGVAQAAATAVGNIPSAEQLALGDPRFQLAGIEAALCVDAVEWRHEAADIRAYYHQLGGRLPRELEEELDTLEDRLRHT